MTNYSQKWDLHTFSLSLTHDITRAEWLIREDEAFARYVTNYRLRSEIFVRWFRRDEVETNAEALRQQLEQKIPSRFPMWIINKTFPSLLWNAYERNVMNEATWFVFNMNAKHAEFVFFERKLYVYNDAWLITILQIALVSINSRELTGLFGDYVNTALGVIVQ